MASGVKLCSRIVVKLSGSRMKQPGVGQNPAGNTYGGWRLWRKAAEYSLRSKIIILCTESVGDGGGDQAAQAMSNKRVAASLK